jgi:hypothetical protein
VEATVLVSPELATYKENMRAQLGSPRAGSELLGALGELQRFRELKIDGRKHFTISAISTTEEMDEANPKKASLYHTPVNTPLPSPTSGRTTTSFPPHRMLSVNDIILVENAEFAKPREEIGAEEDDDKPTFVQACFLTCREVAGV